MGDLSNSYLKAYNWIVSIIRITEDPILLADHNVPSHLSPAEWQKLSESILHGLKQFKSEAVTQLADIDADGAQKINDRLTYESHLVQGVTGVQATLSLDDDSAPDLELGQIYRHVAQCGVTEANWGVDGGRSVTGAKVDIDRFTASTQIVERENGRCVSLRVLWREWRFGEYFVKGGLVEDDEVSSVLLKLRPFVNEVNHTQRFSVGVFRDLVAKSTAD